MPPLSGACAGLTCNVVGRIATDRLGSKLIFEFREIVSQRSLVAIPTGCETKPERGTMQREMVHAVVVPL